MGIVFQLGVSGFVDYAFLQLGVCQKFNSASHTILFAINTILDIERSTNYYILLSNCLLNILIVPHFSSLFLEETIFDKECKLEITDFMPLCNKYVVSS